jgi:S1-C subfamily serine protease
VLEFDVNEKLRYRQWAASPDAGIDVTVVFESEATGTRITFTASGFGGPSIFDTDSTRNGMDEALRDLATYAFIGVRLRETYEGAVVDEIEPGSCAERLGLEVGDLVLMLGGGSVFSNAELAFFQRTHEPGDDCEAVWARGGEIMRATDRFDTFDGMVFARNA